ncbi:hypothetical protein Tco_0106317, partial [Tanacetum coccineum]
MMEIVPVEEVYIKALQKAFSTADPTEDKETMLWVELKRLYEPNPRDQLWELQRYMHDPLEWRLYDTCGVRHVSTGRGHEIFMLVKKDYPLTKGLTILMISNKLQVDQYSELAKYVPTVGVNLPTASFTLLTSFATVEDFPLLHEDKNYSESNMRY